jgi:hypothetical protein
MAILQQLLLLLRPLIWQLSIQPPQTAPILGVDVGQARPHESESKFKRVKAVDTGYGSNDFVVAEAN